MDPLKEMFNRRFYEELALAFNNVYSRFDSPAFVEDVTYRFDSLSLNERLRNTSVVLKKHLPADYRKALRIMYKVIPDLKSGYTNLLFPDYVSLYGQDQWDASMEALRYFTSFGSSEFAVRVFLKQDFTRTIERMYQWAEDSDPHVRRLASEGSRPRLPWSFKLDAVIKDPTLTRPILTTLQADEALYVRKSVANHLNDISKDHPDYMLQMIGQWDQANPGTAWIIRHASRTLIKKGNAQSLLVFNYEKNVRVRIEDFTIYTSALKLGELLHFGFTVVSDKKKEQKLVIDYIIHYRKKSGALLPKVFKLKELLLGAEQRVHIIKKQVIKDFTTRKHFPGTHILEIQVNGKQIARHEFELRK